MSETNSSTPTLKTHKVESGDTLYGIIQKYYGGFDTKLLKGVLDYNRIINPNNILVGQLIFLPGNWGTPGLKVGDVGMVKPPIENHLLAPHTITRMVEKRGGSVTPSSEKPTIVEDILPEGEYWTEKYHKDLIVLHFTAGYTAESAIETFKKPGRVATAFVVDTDGKVIRLFDEKYWSYHLGIKGADSENWRHDKRSIGIEIVNIGPVWKQEDGMLYEDYTHRRTYGEDDIVLGKNRDADGGVKFPGVQIDNVIRLVNWLAMQYDIPRKMVQNPQAFQLPGKKDFKGVIYHQTYRRDKYDLGVAFPLKRFQNECRLESV